MINKKTWLLIPTTIFPYIILFALDSTFSLTITPLFRYIIENVFGGNALLLLLTLVIICLIACVLSAIHFIICLKQGNNALKIAKTAMIIKLIQIPAYLFIFFASALFIFSLFSIPIAIVLLIFNYTILVLTSLITISSIINSVKQGIFEVKEVVFVALLQFVFCADVFATIIYYNMLKKRYNKHKKAVD